MSGQTLAELRQQIADQENQQQAAAPEGEQQEAEELQDEQVNDDDQQEDLDQGEQASDEDQQNEDQDQDQGQDQGQDGEQDHAASWINDVTSIQDEQAPITANDLNGSLVAQQSLSGSSGQDATQALLLEMQAKIEQLSSGGQAQAQLNQAPKREDFLDHPDPDAAWVEAYLQHDRAEQQRQQAEQQAAAQQVARKDQINKKVTAHYDRAVDFVKKHNIDVNTYQSANIAFKQAISNNQDIANEVISNLGDKSEELTYFVGANPARRNQLTKAITDDPNGLKAMFLLGQYKQQITAPSQRKTRAPKPAKNLNSSSQGGKSNVVSLKRAYDKAIKSGDAQKGYDIRKKARASGQSVKDWD